MTSVARVPVAAVVAALAFPAAAGPDPAPVPSAARPDLTITEVSVGAVSGIGRAVSVTVRNAGTGPATLFKMGALQLGPKRLPLLFEVCALTFRPPGGTTPCQAVWEVGTLDAGASRTYSGFVTFPVETPTKSDQSVEFMADSCFAEADAGLPAWCRVNESNEANNTSIAEVGVP